MTYVAQEVPDWVVGQPPGADARRAWGIAGYSEGGYCAANIALQHPNLFGYAGSLSGYFAPIESQVPPNGKPGGKPVDVFEFAHDKKLLALNSPDEYVTRVPTTVSVPQFFLAAGAADAGDVAGGGDLQAGTAAQGRRRAAGHRPRRRAPGDRLAGGADADARLDDAAARYGRSSGSSGWRRRNARRPRAIITGRQAAKPAVVRSEAANRPDAALRRPIHSHRPARLPAASFRPEMPLVVTRRALSSRRDIESMHSVRGCANVRRSQSANGGPAAGTGRSGRRQPRRV